jgi:DNA-binding NtrC family response regulator
MNRRYLVVDDNEAFAENLAEILAETGAAVDIAFDGPSALAKLETVTYDAIISDMKMPVMSGPELLRRVHQLDPQVPTVAVTAYTTDTHLREAWHEGVLAVLPKPVPIPRLVEILAVARRDGIVAVVDDDPAMVDNLTEALHLQGFGVVSAGSISEVAELAHVKPFVAIADLRLPGGPDGDAVVQLAARHAGLPIIVLTGYAQAAVPAPALHIFHKPFDTAELIAAIEALHVSRRPAP